MTLNETVALLQGIQENHPQLNHFFFGEEFDFASSGVVVPAVMIAVLQPSTLAGSTLTYNFKIYIGDIAEKDKSNKTEILSDTLLIALDVVYLLQNSRVYNLVIDTNIIFNDFEDSFDCELYGHWFELKIKVSNPFDRCAVPQR